MCAVLFRLFYSLIFFLLLLFSILRRYLCVDIRFHHNLLLFKCIWKNCEWHSALPQAHSPDEVKSPSAGKWRMTDWLAVYEEHEATPKAEFSHIVNRQILILLLHARRM